MEKVKMSCSETGAQLLARLGSRPDISKVEPILFPMGLKGKDVLELYGSEGCGKTEMLLHIACSLILPKTWRGWNFGGCGASLIFIDTDYKFSILRLVTLLEKRITHFVEHNQQVTLSENSEATFNPTSRDIEVVIKESLERLNVLQCKSSLQLLATLHSLEARISTNPDICVIMIDSISAFYWLDRCTGGESVTAQETVMNLIVDILSHLVNDYNLVLLATKSAYFKRKVKESEKGDCIGILDMDHSEFLSRNWSRFVKHRLILKKDVNSSNAVQFSVNSSSWQKKFIVAENGISIV
ncbi:DNA repair protein XRCC2-like [Mizuhopecten yessoensis]|uniref:DNA repair protein XRCC2-like n=1 Tax=Mizuhopecten yessoensis TaxID=6573 RepID=UPI000B45B83B|nr:DNA repair protein XRCC2-like [Mizuhopecten yessoensis]